MIYSFDITVPANTSAAAPQRTELEMEYGIISQVGIGFPAGPAGLTHVTIERDGRQVWPSNAQGDFAWDDHFFNWPEDYPLLVEPFVFTAVTWSLDDAWPHQVTLQFALLQPGAALPADQSQSLLGQIVSLLGGGKKGS